jgi:hypothetical protein
MKSMSILRLVEALNREEEDVKWTELAQDRERNIRKCN